MKTSEIIRGRIDSKLSPAFSIPMRTQDYEKKLDSYFLCRMFRDQPKVLEYIQDALKEQAAGTALDTGSVLSESYDAMDMREPYAVGVDACQVYRFFFADMMAAYFESIGD